MEANKEMGLEEIRELKASTETVILGLLKDFEDATEFRVDSITIDHIIVGSKCGSRLKMIDELKINISI